MFHKSEGVCHSLVHTLLIEDSLEDGLNLSSTSSALSWIKYILQNYVSPSTTSITKLENPTENLTEKTPHRIAHLSTIRTTHWYISLKIFQLSVPHPFPITSISLSRHSTRLTSHFPLLTSLPSLPLSNPQNQTLSHTFTKPSHRTNEITLITP